MTPVCRAPGLCCWIASVDHKSIGRRYIVTAFAFLLLGGLQALVIRLLRPIPGRNRS